VGHAVPGFDQGPVGAGSTPAASRTWMTKLAESFTSLEKVKQLDNTVILFTSDNGGFEKYKSKTDYNGKYEHPLLGDNRPLKGGKAACTKAACAVPAFAYWKGKLQPAVAEERVSMLDWYPTFAKLAGADVPVAAKIEGRDVLADLDARRPRETGGANALLEHRAETRGDRRRLGS